MKKILIILITGLLTFSFTGCKHNLGSGDVNSGDNGGGSAGNGGKQTPPLPEFNWYETPEQLPEGTNGTFGKERTYVYFGVWPQDVVPEEDVAGLALDENAETTIELGNFKYVKGSDGSYYVQCTENHYNVEYEYNNGTKIGWSDRWFKAMPIKWCVLTKDYNKTGTALLLAENELTANVPYYVEETDSFYNNCTGNN